jgi:hypothetical protein
MWWTIIVGVFLLYPAVEMVEEWRLNRLAKYDLSEMRKHVDQHHAWDVTRGRWVA